MATERAEEIQLVVFQLAGELYGADISVVREVTPLQRVTKVPRTPGYIEGVTNLRGRVIPVIDLRRRLSLPASPPTKASRIAVAELDGGQVGMIVDGVSEVLRISADRIEKTPPVLNSGIDAQYIKGVAKIETRLIILLDLPRVLVRDERKVV